MAGTLDRYRRKRHFDRTAEPAGQAEPADAAGAAARPLRFVVQHHLASRDHYDFRLEWRGVLLSWAVPKGPSWDRRDKRLAVHVEDHPFEYRNFEGTIPRGEYGGGVVMIWDEGTWTPAGDVDKAFGPKGVLKFSLDGKRLKGTWALVRMKPRDGEKNDNWLLLKERDQFENSDDIHNYDTSVRTGRTMRDIEDGNIIAAAPAAGTAKPGKSRAAARRRGAGKVPAAAVEALLSHPEKVLFPAAGVTKGEVAAYYAAVAGRMLPFLDKRIISAVRCPGGVAGKCFYKKHPRGDTPGLVTVAVPGKDGSTEDYFYVDSPEGLIAEVQMNTLEFHLWASRADRLERPDMMVFDLDPDEGLELDRVRQGVRDVKSILDELSLPAYLKTSGGKGYHVVIPFRPGADWEAFERFAETVARTMEAKWPDRYTANVRKARRRQRIFIDWMRNGRGATSVAPYSLRARDRATVSMPIAWRELGSIAPDAVTIPDALARLRRKDPWAGFWGTPAAIKAALRKA